MELSNKYLMTDDEFYGSRRFSEEPEKVLVKKDESEKPAATRINGYIVLYRLRIKDTYFICLEAVPDNYWESLTISTKLYKGKPIHGDTVEWYIKNGGVFERSNNSILETSPTIELEVESEEDGYIDPKEYDYGDNF